MDWRPLLSTAAQAALQADCESLTALRLCGESPSPLILVQARPGYWDGILEARGTVLISSAAMSLECLRQDLEEAGFAGRATFICEPLTPRQRTLHLDRLEEAPPQAGEWLVILHPFTGVSALEKLPLYGCSVVVTREASQGEAVVEQLQSLGADVVNLPVLAFVEPDDVGPLSACLERLEEFHWLLFTSANGVEGFMLALRASGRDLRALGHVQIGAIGPGTAQALSRWHLNVDCLPEEYVAEGFLKALERFPLSGKAVLLARAQEAREVLPEGLRARGAQVEVVPTYKTIAPTGEAAVIGRAGNCQWVLLTSSSCARNYREMVGVREAQRVLAIGPITAKTARECGWSDIVVAPQYTLEGMLRCLLESRGDLASIPIKESNR